MNQRELSLFLHLAKSLNFARTSEACHVTPSSLSRVIQRLEAEVGTPLFERDNRHVALTPAGRAFREFADETRNNWLLLKERLAHDERVLTGDEQKAMQVGVETEGGYFVPAATVGRRINRLPGAKLAGLGRRDHHPGPSDQRRRQRQKTAIQRHKPIIGCHGA